MLEELFVKLMQKYTDKEVYILKCWDEIYKYYTSESRLYHNLDHLSKMMIELEGIKSEAKELDTLLFSIYYHDIIYEVTNSDNEDNSAIFLKDRLIPTRFSQIDKCVYQIKQTKEHKKSEDNDTNILLDLDLAILGSNADDYQQYYYNIRKEYSIYKDSEYRLGRKRVLNKMLDQNTIYKTDYFITKYEETARNNLSIELKSLNLNSLY